MASSQNLPPMRHLGFQCVSCKVADFRGRRYSCGLCPDYHLCAACFDADLVPEVFPHLYYHPLKVYYARAEYQLYFDDDGENYSIDNPLMQSYKCALCDIRGLTSFDHYKHLSQLHLSHPDHKAYIAIVYANYQAELLVAPDALPHEDELGLQDRRVIADALFPESQTGGTTQSQPRRGFYEDSLTLAQLLVQLKMLNLTAPEYPIRCVEILKRATSLRAHLSGQEVVKTAEKYISLIEHEVATGLGERRQRLGRTSNGSVRLVNRNSGLVMVPNSSSAAGLRAASSRTLALPRCPEIDQDYLRWMSFMNGNEVSGFAPTVESLRKYRQAQLAAKLPKPCQDTEGQQMQIMATDRNDKRFLCSKFRADSKPPSRKRDGIKLLKANFTEALICSMLAEEELTELPLMLFSPDAIKNVPTERRVKVSPVFLKPLQRKKVLPIKNRIMNEMKCFYKALDKYKAGLENPKLEADKNMAILTSSIAEDPTNSNSGLNSDGNGDGSGTRGNGNESAVVDASAARSDAEILELTMASIIQGIDAIIDDGDDDI